MDNFMAKEMTRRYSDYLHTSDLNERGVKIIYYWVMNSIESFFWSYRIKASFSADLYAKESQMFLVIADSTGEEHEFVHYPTYRYDDERLLIMLENFIEIFNNTEYPLSDKISSPCFYAFDSGIWEHPLNRSKYNGYHKVSIFVDMLPEADDDPANHGPYA